MSHIKYIRTCDDQMEFAITGKYVDIIHIYAEMFKVDMMEMLDTILALFLFAGVCPRCGAPVLRRSRFCTKCGLSLIVNVEAHQEKTGASEEMK